MKKLTQRQLDKFKKLVESEDDTVNQVFYDFANDPEYSQKDFEILLGIVIQEAYETGQHVGRVECGNDIDCF